MDKNKDRVKSEIIIGLIISSFLLIGSNIYTIHVLENTINNYGNRNDIRESAIIGDNFVYDDLNESDRIFLESLIFNIKKGYLVGTKEIIFKYNISEDFKTISNKDDWIYNHTELINGFNRINPDMSVGSTIFIKFSRDAEKMKSTICHELLHNFFHGDSFSHDIVYDVADYQTCFEEEPLNA